MFGKDLSRQRYSLLRVDNAVCPNAQGELVIVSDLTDTGVVHRVVHLEDRGVDRVDGEHADDLVARDQLVLLGGDIASALIQRDLHVQNRAVGKGRDVQLGVEDLNLAVALDALGSDLAGTLRRDLNDLGTVRMEFSYQALHVQNDLGDVFLDAGDGRELVKNSVYLDRCDGYALKGREQYAAKRVAQRVAEASL